MWDWLSFPHLSGPSTAASRIVEKSGRRVECAAAKAVDRYLVRPNGLYYLNLDRTWRIGATAHRIISLAESNGSRFRDLL